MNGAAADLPPKTNNTPGINSTKIIGNKNHFFHSIEMKEGLL